MCKHKLGHSVGARPWRVANDQPAALRVLDVDIIHAYAAPDDELQPSALNSRVNLGNPYLGCGTHDHYVKVLYGF